MARLLVESGAGAWYCFAVGVIFGCVESLWDADGCAKALVGVSERSVGCRRAE